MTSVAYYKVRQGGGFALRNPNGGFPISYPPGTLIEAGSPLVKTHAAYLEPVEAMTAGPGERRSLLGIRLPSGRTLAEVTTHREGHAHRTTFEGEADMAPHRNALPPEHEDSPASPFAPAQPAAGVVADDVPAVQNPAGGPKASTVTAEEARVEELNRTATDPAAGAGPVPTGQTVEGEGSGSDDGVLRGQALDDALRERGLSTSGSADEKRARVAEYDEQNS